MLPAVVIVRLVRAIQFAAIWTTGTSPVVTDGDVSVSNYSRECKTAKAAYRFKIVPLNTSICMPSKAGVTLSGVAASVVA